MFPQSIGWLANSVLRVVIRNLADEQSWREFAGIDYSPPESSWLRCWNNSRHSLLSWRTRATLKVTWSRSNAWTLCHVAMSPPLLTVAMERSMHLEGRLPHLHLLFRDLQFSCHSLWLFIFAVWSMKEKNVIWLLLRYIINQHLSLHQMPRQLYSHVTSTHISHIGVC